MSQLLLLCRSTRAMCPFLTTDTQQSLNSRGQQIYSKKKRPHQRSPTIPNVKSPPFVKTTTKTTPGVRNDSVRLKSRFITRQSKQLAIAVIRKSWKEHATARHKVTERSQAAELPRGKCADSFLVMREQWAAAPSSIKWRSRIIRFSTEICALLGLSCLINDFLDFVKFLVQILQ